MAHNLQEFIRKNMEIAANDFGMIHAGDRILVGVSGGLDSHTLLKLLLGKKVYVSNDISVVAVHLDLGFDPNSQSNLDQLTEYFTSLNIDFHIEKTDIGVYAHNEDNRLNPCFLCSRRRRKRIFELAEQYGCNKIAYGHHKDDIIETLLINIFYGREIGTMKPKQEMFGGRYFIIRPLAYLWERTIKKYAREQNFPIFETKCPTGEISKRKVVKDLLRQLQHDHKQVKENIFKALHHVNPDYLLDRRYWPEQLKSMCAGSRSMYHDPAKDHVCLLWEQALFD